MAQRDAADEDGPSACTHERLAMLLLPRALPLARGTLALTSLCTCLVLAGCAEAEPAPGAEQRAESRATKRSPVTESKSAEGFRQEGAPGQPRGAANEAARGLSGKPVEASWVREIPGLGPLTRSRIPVASRQALVVTGEGRNSPKSGVVLYERNADTGWEPVTNRWPAHNALRGWTHNHQADDLRSPIGVFTLGDAGGRLPDPGARLPYDESEDFEAPGTGFLGEPLEGSFDYVVAIDYNRTSGTTPLDQTRPLGLAKGGGVWIHVDHEGPTQACVSLSRTRMVDLLRELDPAKRPVIVMGDAVALRD
ncbi:hypothetical protein GCM10011583_59270 [Streptomyces camponoticapitis]|uniref:Lipoprotein n=2 Tax=Streptomyces camponoticapitis TaxID=1616125 RepID=A0ABQ2ET66_9ACTN|nr:hypothetical protein [Streptomyces camponoticapitis]GGK19538.1 hypothetical protein GCM10011583_59270 [Streptomyces camponoticapitis]